MSSLSASGVMRQVAEAIPMECHNEIIIVGSLAAGYRFFGKDSQDAVSTKDVDGMLAPNAKAIRNGKIIAEQLFDAGWTLRKDRKWGEPGKRSTPNDQLPILRLHPPGSTEWFLEFAAAPPQGSTDLKVFERLSTRNGDFALYSFRFLALAEEAPLTSEFGILYARPEMMALANLLHHPRISRELIVGSDSWKRSNKDLGRVLALAWLSTELDSEALEKWPTRWRAALEKRFAGEWRDLAARSGSGLRALLDSPPDLQQATSISNLSLLAGRELDAAALRATARRVLHDAVAPLEAAAR